MDDKQGCSLRLGREILQSAGFRPRKQAWRVVRQQVSGAAMAIQAPHTMKIAHITTQMVVYVGFSAIRFQFLLYIQQVQLY